MSDAAGEDPSDASPDEEGFRWEEWVNIAREIAVTVAIVLVIAAVLFGLSGVWPPLVAVESDSMEPNIMTGDLVFIVDNERYAADGAIDGTGVLPADQSNEYESFDRPGDVIIFAPNGDPGRTPIIHRAHLWVEQGEDWYERGDPSLMGGASSCDDVSSCPAPHAGFITHGDNNAFYDQVQSDTEPVRPEWVVARAWTRVPLVGHLRLIIAEYLAVVVPVGIWRANTNPV